MRKLPKGPAIAAAILSIFSLLGVISTLVTIIGAPTTTPLNVVTLFLTFVATALLVVVLFRRKADTFAAVACFAQIPGAILAVITSLPTISFLAKHLNIVMAKAAFIGYIVLVLYNLLRVGLYVLMALQGIRKNAGKSKLCVILPIVALVLMVLQFFLTFDYINRTNFISLRYFFRLSPSGIGMVIGNFLGTVIGVLPLLFTGMAFGKVRPAEEEAAPQYQQYQQPMYQAPQYQAQYQQPMYQQAPQQPVYQAPQYQQPQYQQPQYQQPQYQQPYQAPQQPVYQAPQYQQPQYQAPQYQAPQYQAPQYQAPQYQQPYQAPQQPMYQAPQYQAPQYEAPQAPSQEQ